VRRPIAILVLAVLASPLAAADPPKSVGELDRDLRAAYQKGDMAGFLRDAEELARLRPGQVRNLYNLACAQARNGQTDAALATLRALLAQRVAFDLDADTDFDSIRKTPGYAEVVAGMAALRQERVGSDAAVAFTIPEKEVAAEGVAWDPVTRAFFVASVRQGKILRIASDGKVSVFVPPGGGLRSPLGIGVDAKRRTLWVTNETIPHMNGGKEGDPPDSSLLEFDLDSGKLRKRHLPPSSERAPHFDDLAVAADGRVYVNDGFNPRIYVLEPGGEMALWLEGDAIDGGTQGLAATPDGKRLYVSDYRGLYRIDVATRKATRLPVPSGLSTGGIDGLVYADGRLVAIQNGIEPNRVSVFDLAPDGASIARARILVMNHPVLDEPTLGTVVDGVLYFSANNQGHRYHDVKNPPKPEDLKDAVILKVNVR
jgi:sugar lactone lactonase YvrE